jgi:hypothetical protein
LPRHRTARNGNAARLGQDVVTAIGKQRQALDVVMQIKGQRITNIKQKYGPKFEPIMFTVEEAPGAGSIFVEFSLQTPIRA